MLSLPCTSHFCALQQTPLEQALLPHCAPQELPLQVTGAGQERLPLQSMVVVPDASLSTPLPQALSALHSTLQVLAPSAHRTLPEQAPLLLQWIWQFCALQLI